MVAIFRIAAAKLITTNNSHKAGLFENCKKNQACTAGEYTPLFTDFHSKHFQGNRRRAIRRVNILTSSPVNHQ